MSVCDLIDLTTCCSIESAWFESLKIRKDKLFLFQLAALHPGGGYGALGEQGAAGARGGAPHAAGPLDPRLHPALGRAVQVDSIRTVFKAPVSKRLKLEQEKSLSNFAFDVSLRRYMSAIIIMPMFALANTAVPLDVSVLGGRAVQD
jgi:hypothetical protein